MDYMTLKEASEKWGVTPRRINYYCAAGRIPGAVKMATIWLIPKGAKKPEDRRYKKRLTIENIVETYGQYIYNLALRLSASPELADDLVQETFIKAWEHIAEIRDQKAIKKWLQTICINEFRMTIRKSKKVSYAENIEELEQDGNLLTNPQPLPDEEIVANEEVRKLRNGCFLAMTRKLSINQRIAFSLVDMFGLSISETAEIMDLTPKAIKGLLYRARQNLQSFFQDHCSFIDVSNPCHCSEWIEFMKDRNTIQAKMRQRISDLDYKKRTDYIYNPEAEQIIIHYYHNLPEEKPHQEWYDNVIAIVENFFANRRQ